MEISANVHRLRTGSSILFNCVLEDPLKQMLYHSLTWVSNKLTVLKAKWPVDVVDIRNSHLENSLQSTRDATLDSKFTGYTTNAFNGPVCPDWASPAWLNQSTLIKPVLPEWTRFEKDIVKEQYCLADCDLSE